jgi:hypothetical protein
VVQPTTCDPLPTPPDNGEDCIYVLIPDEFVGLSIGFFKGKKSELTPGGNVTTKGRKREEKFFFWKKIQNHHT